MTCFCLFLIVPTIVHSENTGASTDPLSGEKVGESRSILFGNVKKVDNVLKEKTDSIETVLQETINGLHKTETSLSKPSESKPDTSKIEATGNLLNTIVTDTVEKTTSEMTNAVNDTVNSVVNGLPTVPVVTPFIKDVSETVKKTTSYGQTVAENTGEFANETLKSTIHVSIDKVIEPVDIVAEIMNIPQEIFQGDEKASSGNENVFTNLEEHSHDVGSVPEQEPITPLAPEIGTDVLIKQVGTSELEKHSDIGLDDGIEISMNGEVNLDVDSILGATSVDRHSIVKELKVLEQTKGSIDPFGNSKTIVLENKNVDKPNLPTGPSKKWDRLPVAIIMETTPPTTSPSLEVGGQSDLSFWGIVDVFILQSSSGGKWIPMNEYAMVKWAHAPPGEPPQQSPFLMCNEHNKRG